MACHLRGSISDEHSAFLAVICHGRMGIARKFAVIRIPADTSQMIA